MRRIRLVGRMVAAGMRGANARIGTGVGAPVAVELLIRRKPPSPR